jgi:hypothetical protein
MNYALPAAVTPAPNPVIPDPTPTIPAEADGLLLVLNWASGIGLALGVLGVIIAGIGMLIVWNRGQGGDHLAKLGWVLGGCIIITGAGGIVRAFV